MSISVDKNSMRDHLDQLLNRGNEKKELVNNLVANDDYINWLDNFTRVHPEFINLEFPNLNYCHEIGLNGIYNLAFLKDFYNFIAIYANKNYIFPNDFDGYGNYYVIKINDVFYKIGILKDNEQDVSFFCCRVDDGKQIHQFIDFKDIRENKIRPEAFDIEKNLDKLAVMIEQLVLNDNIPIEAIADTTDKVIKKIRVKVKE